MLGLTSFLRRVKNPNKNFGQALHFVNLGNAGGHTYEMVPDAGGAVRKTWVDGWKWRVVSIFPQLVC